MNDAPFSKRYGFLQIANVEISVRHNAPYELRGVLVELAYGCGFRPKALRSLVCRVLLKRPNPDNWSEYPNIDSEVRELLDNCDWYRIYDVAESLYQTMSQAPSLYDSEQFQMELNTFFFENGIGWQLADGRIEVRGPEALQEAVEKAKSTLDAAGLRTARLELHEALMDLSRRPKADISGSIQHSMAALECVARDVTGSPRATLGEIIKHDSCIIPKPLDEAVAKAWGYASEHARHVREGHLPLYEDAELVVGICAAVITYLVKKNKA